MDHATHALAADPPVTAAPALSSPAPTPLPDLDRAVLTLADQARAFARTPPREKAALLRATLLRLRDAAPDLAAATCRLRGLDPDSAAAAEAWLAGPAPALTYARLLAESLDDIGSAGRPALDAADLRKRPDGRVVARLVPRGWAERAARRGRETEVLFAAGTEPEDVIAGQAAFYRAADPEGGVALVLGAGHDAAGGVLDALCALFVEGHVVLLMPAPEAAHLGPIVARAFAPIVERGFLQVVYGGADEGAHLAAQTAVRAVHFTGGREAYDRLAALDKPVHAELGNVGPVIVVPCLYAKSELTFLAQSLASQLAHGAGLDAVAPRVLVLAACWPQRGLFLDLLQQAFAAIPPRRVYLPGGAARFAALTDGRAEILRVGAEGPDTLPWTILPAVDPAGDPIFSTLAGAGSVMAAVSLGCDDPIELLAAATTFCNERLGGSLAAQIVMHPIHEDDPAVFGAVQRAVIDLRYGAVGINQWPALLRWGAAAPWGGHASATPEAPKSGRGFHNDARMLPRVDKAVLHGPAWPGRKPAWLQGNAEARRIAERLTAFQAAPRVGDLWAVAGR